MQTIITESLKKLLKRDTIGGMHIEEGHVHKETAKPLPTTSFNTVQHNKEIIPLNTIKCFLWF